MLKVDQLETSGPEAWPGAVFPEFSSCFRYPTLGAEGDRCTQKQKQKFTLKSQRTWKKQDELARQKTPKHLKAALIKNPSMNTPERNEKDREKRFKWQQISYHKLWRPEKKWHNIFEVLNEGNIDPENDGKLRDFINNRSTL